MFKSVLDEDKKFVIDKADSLAIASGQAFFLEVIILDQDDRPYVDQNEATAALNFAEKESIDKLSTIINYEAVANEGVFSFLELNVVTTPLSQVKIELEVEGIEDYDNIIEFIEEYPKMSLDVRACIEGESYGKNLACKPCGPGFYLYEN